MSDPHSAQDVDQAIEATLGAGFDQADADQLMQQLGQELERQADEHRLVLSGDEPEAWVLGAEGEAQAPSGMAGRFLGFYSTALRREICDEQGGCLKEKYSSMLLGGDLKAKMKTLAPVVLGAIGVSTTLAAPASVAAIVALWLLRVGLEQWCAASSPASAGAAPASSPKP